MIVIVDYGMGNLRSVEKAFAFLGRSVTVSDDPSILREAKGIVLPGVGSFGDAMGELERRGMVEALKDAIGEGIPLLGICLGYQLLFDASEESPGVAGLGMMPGKVVRFPASVKIPHMGWNDADFTRAHPVLEGVEENSYFYFVHSYYVVLDEGENALTTTSYGVDFASGATRNNIVGFQFHPEKSSSSGLRILDNFACLGA
jgi:glutamine amidotransferase